MEAAAVFMFWLFCIVALGLGVLAFLVIAVGLVLRIKDELTGG